MDADRIRRSLTRMAHEIVERNRGVEDVVLVGIVSKGDVLARRLAATLTQLETTTVPWGRLDVTGHRDDLHLRPRDGRREESRLPDVDGKVVVLVDDVIHHGRTARAAIDELMDLGRPRAREPARGPDRPRPPRASHPPGLRRQERADSRRRAHRGSRRRGGWARPGGDR